MVAGSFAAASSSKGPNCFLYALESGFATHRHSDRGGLGVVGSATVAIEGGKFLVCSHRPLGPQPREPLKPPLAILSLNTGRLPD
jgi:hypothetical protein